jgi:hypothetical protein
MKALLHEDIAIYSRSCEFGLGDGVLDERKWKLIEVKT